MKSKLMLAGAALAVFAAASAAQAGPAKGHAGATATPSQPVPYTCLDAYLKATPKARAQMMSSASSNTMQTDAAANVGGTPAPATTPAPAPGASPAGVASGAATSPADPSQPAQGSSTEGAGATPSGAVNPPAEGAPPSDSTGDQGAAGTAAPTKP